MKFKKRICMLLTLAIACCAPGMAAFAAEEPVLHLNEEFENYYGGMAEGLIQITDLASFAKEGTQEKVDEATTAILSGENNVFDGVLETNTGKKIGAANSTLDDATITGNINWYYKNVVIVK